MELRARSYVALTAALSAVLTAAVVRDIYVDWQFEGKALASTIIENALPVALGVFVFLAGYRIYARHDRSFMASVTRWQYIGAAGLLLISVEVVGLQLIQGELKPSLIVLQMTLGGAAAGTLVGITSARESRARAAVARERDRFEALFEKAPAEVADIDLTSGDPRIEQVNAAFGEMFDCPPGSARGRDPFEIVGLEESVAARVRTAIVEGTEYETEIRVPTGTEDRAFQLRVVSHGHRRGYLLFTDVTELKRTQEELEETVERLEQSNERLQQFAYIASHDLKEPLRMVSSYVSLLETEYGDQLDEEADEYMEFAVDGAERMQAMVDGLLDYSRVRTEGEEFTRTDPEAVLEETRRDLGMLIEERDATVTSDDLPPVEADRNQLAQVFQNLIENAIEHGGDGVTVHVSARSRPEEVVFSVADDGPGIPADRQDRVFEIFEQGSRDDEGTGIGLAICERIVSRHGGEMWVDSEAGEGTTVHFSIPSA